MIIKEIETGPHFVTYYSDDRAGQIAWLPGFYRLFIKKYKDQDLTAVQQKGFVHETLDPNVYHRHEEPRYKSHFHIRTINAPTPEQLNDFKSLLLQGGATFAEDLKLSDIKGKYPKQKLKETYLQYIDRLRNQ